MTLGPNQRRWLDALASGEYRKQDHGPLYYSPDRAYSLMGVATRVLLGPPDYLLLGLHGAWDHCSTHPPVELARGHLGLHSRLGDPHPAVSRQYRNLNKIARLSSFPWMAEYIETNAEIYFRFPN